ncbi:MAG: tetratricopeptide repeat protein, partial [Nitrospira sp.]|nr:tetratricopeptide repeat protein [Nitrospira sp.]
MLQALLQEQTNDARRREVGGRDLKQLQRSLQSLGVAVTIVSVLVFRPIVADAADEWEALFNAGIAAREQAKYREAEGLLLLAGRELEQQGVNDERMAALLNQLGLIFQEEGRYERAKPYYEQALTIWEQTHGLDHAEAASVLHNLAEIYQEEGDFARAEQAYLRSLEIGERNLGCGHPDV